MEFLHAEAEKEFPLWIIGQVDVEKIETHLK